MNLEEQWSVEIEQTIMGGVAVESDAVYVVTLIPTWLRFRVPTVNYFLKSLCR